MSVPVQHSEPMVDGINSCTALKLRRLTRKVSQIFDEELAPHGLTVGQLGILAGLTRSKGIGIAMLAERLSADASTLSRLLKPLEKSGLISIEHDPDDRRAKLLRLTEAGSIRRQAAAVAWKAAQLRVSDLLGDSRLAALRFIVDDAYQQL